MNTIYKLSLKKGFYKFEIKRLSIVHNYHSPTKLWVYGREFKYGDNLEEYNIYIQAFLNRRFIHKKEIYSKIKVLKDINRILKPYHNSFYVQITYPLNNLFDFDYLKYMKQHRILDTGYIISRFLEEYEKPMYDAMLEKILINGRVEYMEDSEYFSKNRKEINRLINIFYEGEELSGFEREIERAYLILKQGKMAELINKYTLNTKLKREECFLSFSELNRMNGHVNFRMLSPEYFFKSAPIFERINVERMFYSLRDMRYNILKPHQIIEKIKLKYYYRGSLLKSKHRVKFLSYFLYLRIFQYLESYEYHNEFNLSLNFKINFNMIVFHVWLVIQRLLQLMQSDHESRKYCQYIMEDLFQHIVSYFKQNLNNFQFTHQGSLKIFDIAGFTCKLLNFYTFNFHVLNSQNYYENIRNLMNETIFENSRDKDDKYLKRFCYYAVAQLQSINNISYDQIEKADFDFSVNVIPINSSDFIDMKDKVSQTADSIKSYLNIAKNEKNLLELLNQYNNNHSMFFKTKDEKIIAKTKDQNHESLLRTFEALCQNYGTNPFNDPSNFCNYDVENNRITKIQKYMKREIIFETAIAHEKYLYEQEQLKKSSNNSIWEEKAVNEIDESESLGLASVNKLREKRKKYIENKYK